VSRQQGQRTWDVFREAVAQWPPGWMPIGLAREDCGCLTDRLSGSRMWRPCMAHESEGHVAVISEVDGMHVARCLVLACPWSETRQWEHDAIGAAQEHWRQTRGT
jgi:hypothetical protein